MKIKNPILKGFNPDPSITKKEDKYYIATSTFDWMPGVQIHESSDLINWELVSHPIDDLKLLNMRGNLDSGGIWAPDLSYYDGKFWLVYSNVQVVNGSFKDVKNYLITAEDIRGPWSDLVYLNGIGFDASLFHDDDGKKYLVQMQWDHRPYNHPFMGIRCTEYDHKSKKLIRDNSKIIWKGTDIKLTEAPHLYKMNGYYYLFCAEGGTTYSHAETVSRSKDIFGDYEGQPEIFITAFDSPYNELQKCGHGSLVKTDDDEWYFAHLTSRPWHHSYESQIDPRGWCTLGRETAIQKVYWDDDKWPHILGGKEGIIEVDAPKNFKDSVNKNDEPINQFDDFDDDKLDINFNTVKVPFEQIGKIEDSKLVLSLGLEGPDVGVMEALASQNKAGEILHFGFDWTPTCLQGINDGRINAIVDQDAYTIGVKVIENLVKSVEGEEIDKTIPIDVNYVKAEELEAYGQEKDKQMSDTVTE